MVGEQGEMTEIQIGPYGHHNLIQFNSNGYVGWLLLLLVVVVNLPFLQKNYF